MFVHLNKKISIPNCSQVRCIAWSWQHEFIACGGEAGMLKVIKLENVNQASKNFQVNQTLESHKANVESVCWNEKFQKLTSSDANGTIIVWMFYKGMWYEEMVNNRQKSLVTGMAWTRDGNKICIVYEDGAIITGSVDGSRLWGKELKNTSLNQVEWSPDGKIILIGTKDMEIHIFDHGGDLLRKMSFKPVAKAEKLIAIKWCSHSLIIAFDNGLIQLMRNESDDDARMIDCEMRITSIEWNCTGDLFVVTGNGGSRNFLKIFNRQGELLTVTKVPGNEIHDCSWEKNSRKLVLAVDSFMYFANLKCQTSWCFLSNAISFVRDVFDDDDDEIFEKKKYLTFWELKTNKRYERLVKNFVQMASCHHYCLITQNIANDSDAVGVRSASLIIEIDDQNHDRITCVTASEKFLIVGFAEHSATINQYMLPNVTLINKISIDGIVNPLRMALNRNSTKLALTDRNGKFYLYDFEANNEQTWADGNWIEMTGKLNDVWDFRWSTDHNDLLVLMEKNKLIVINLHKAVKILDPIITDGYLCSFQRLSMQTLLLDQLIADIGNERTNRQLDINDYMENVACQYVNDIRDFINEKNSVTDAINYAIRMPELTELWHILGEECLKNLDIETAYLTMIKTRDYKGLQFIKRLNRLKDSNLKQAEVCAYQNQLEQAESTYLESDRPDLALYLNKLSGNFERVRTLLESKNLAEYHADNHDWQEAIRYYEKVNAYDRLAECYMFEEKYDALVTLVDKVDDEKVLVEMAMFLESLSFCKDSVRAYIKAGQFEMATNACVKLSEWKMATELADQYRTKNIDILLEKYVGHLEADHKYVEMIQVYRKANKIEKAVAIIMKLIDETKKEQDASLLKKLYLLIGIIHEKNSVNSGNKHETLDELLSERNEILANEHQSMVIVTDPWKGAEAYHFYMLTQRNLYRRRYQQAMNCALHLQDYEEYLTVEQIYSLLALAAYANKCYDICSKAFIKLESIENEQSTWNSWINDLFNVGDGQTRMDEEKRRTTRRKRYEQMAIKIFQKHSPDDEIRHDNNVACKFCRQSIPEYSAICPKCQTRFHACVASGKSIIVDKGKNWTCKRCRHHAIEEEIVSFKNCPLCHVKI
ncbi:hypothetical protein BLA29_000177 [Euroglyphus maynei]|uniref:Uncharacterized protein n=1 Tax=Euroglyphus maynei TaxID=6958 RepID=A0A1Y3BKK5_EURMA|nr:hypothetical protein BLA29_000177 [Euroglyphus maynei]